MHGALPVEDGPHALQTVPVFGAGVEAVHFRKDVHIALQRLAVRPDAVGKLGQDARDLLLLIEVQRP